MEPIDIALATPQPGPDDDAFESMGSVSSDQRDSDHASPEPRRPERDTPDSSTPEPRPPEPRNTVAIVVTRNPGSCFEDALASLASQDHDGLSILVIDDGSDLSINARVADVLPSAYVRRHDTPLGFAASANQVIDMVQGAAFLLFCHDDVAFAPDAVRLLVAEAVNSQLDLVGPKIVAWDDHERLLSVGLTADRIGDQIPLVDPFELDQGQHDVAREVLSLSDAALLVRARAFADLGGFDESLTPPAGATTGPDVGEDADLCWRARQRQLRIGVQPSARVAHLAAGHGIAGSVDASGPEAEAAVRLLVECNRVRSMLTTASTVRVPFVIPLLLVQTAWRTLGPSRRTATSLHFWSIWAEVLRSRSALRQQRKRVQALRLVNDRELLTPLLPIGARARAAVRAEVSADTARAWNAAERTVSERGVRSRAGAAGLVLLGLVLLVGSRRLVFGRVPTIGQFAPLPTPGTLWRLVRTSWRDVGVGTTAPAPPALFMLSVLSTVLLGATGMARTVLTVGMIPAGLFGVWRLSAELARTSADTTKGLRTGLRTGTTTGATAGTTTGTTTGRTGGVGPSTGDRRVRPPDVRIGQTAATVAYGLAPVVYDAFGTGRLDGCLAFGLLPWLLLRVLRLRSTLRRETDLVVVNRRRTAFVTALRLAVPLAAVAALAPGIALVFAWSVVVLAAATALLGDRSVARQMVMRTGVALGGAFVLLAPWSFDNLRVGRHWTLLSGGDQSLTLRGSSLDLLVLHVGRVGHSPLRWMIVVPALLPLLVADGPRLRAAVRAWALIVSGVLGLWLAGRGWIGFLAPHPTVMLAPVSIGLALASGMGIAGFVTDTRSRRFGWRQVLSAGGVLGLAVSGVPVLAATGGGRWNMPARDLSRALSWMPDQVASGSFRTLWVGSPEVLPAAGLRIGPDIALTSTLDGLPDASDEWGARATPGVNRVRALVDSIRARRVTRAGAALSTWGYRYIVLMDRAAPKMPRRALPADVQQGFDDQLDLRQIETEPGLRLFENTQWSSVRIAVPLLADSSISSGRLTSADVLRSQMLLRGPKNNRSFADTISRNAAVVVRSEFDRRWSVRINNAPASRVAVDEGSVMGFVPSISTRTTGGETQSVRLRYDTPLLYRLLSSAQILLWLVSILLIVVWRPRRRSSREARLIEQERIEQERGFDDHDEDGRIGDPFRTSFVAGSTEDEVSVVDAERGFAVFDTVAAGRSRRIGPSAPSAADGGTSGGVVSVPLDGAGQQTTSTRELPEDGSLADELWALWSQRQARGDRGEPE